MSTTAPRPTIADVALLSGVSRATVSKALNGKDRVDPETRARVKNAALQLGYSPNVRAQRLRVGKSNTIALVTALPASIVGEASQLGFLLDLALPVAQSCLEHGYSLLLVPPVTSSSALDMLDIDGAIVIDPVVADPYCAALRRRGVPVITVGRSADTAVEGFVDRGDAGVDTMCSHLYDAGCTNIVILLSEESFSITAGIDDYLARHSPSRAARVSVVRASVAGGESAGYEAALRALHADPTIDAVYAPLDAFAIGALRAAHELGRAVPRDLMVATNYDGRRAATSTPPLTALDLHLPQIARQAVALLFENLAGGSRRAAFAPAPDVIVRESTTRRAIRS
jgi:DNA-binding LacI/PurR family transcriptional regulator